MPTETTPADLAILDAEMFPAADGYAILSPAHRDFCEVLARRSFARSGWLKAQDLTDADVAVVLRSWSDGRSGWSAFASGKDDPAATVREVIEHSAITHHLTHTGGCAVLSPSAVLAVEALRAMDRAAAIAILARTVKVHGKAVTVAAAILNGDPSTEVTGRSQALDTEWHDSDRGQGSVRMRSVSRTKLGQRASEIVMGLAV